jgi:predicted secreted protein
MFNPCIDYCYIRYGREYTHECEDRCDYARVCKELRELKQKVYEDKKKFEDDGK